VKCYRNKVGLGPQDLEYTGKMMTSVRKMSVSGRYCISAAELMVFRSFQQLKENKEPVLTG